MSSASFIALVSLLIPTLAEGRPIPYPVHLYRRAEAVTAYPDVKQVPTRWINNNVLTVAEPYDAYHFRYLELGCTTQHDTEFFDACCHPRLYDQTNADYPAQCNLDQSDLTVNINIAAANAAASSGRHEFIASVSSSSVSVESVSVASVSRASVSRVSASIASASAASASARATSSSHSLSSTVDPVSSSTHHVSSTQPTSTSSVHSTSSSSVHSTSSSSIQSTSSSSVHSSSSSSSSAKPTSTVNSASIASASEASVLSESRASAASAAAVESSAEAAASRSRAEAASRSSAEAAESTPTHSSEAPKQSSSSDSSSQSSSHGGSGGGGSALTGFATFYSQGGAAGACGIVHSDSDYIVAEQYQRYGSGSDCGKKIKITNTANGQSVTATIADECPGCKTDDSLDLSIATFNAIGNPDTGVLNISWEFL